LTAGAQTVADRLRDRGYETAYFGKWHLYERDRQAELVGPAHAKIIVPAGRRGGFEFWEGFESGFLLNDPWLHGSRLPLPTKFEGYQSDVVCDRAAAWICDAAGRKPETGEQRDSTGKAARSSPFRSPGSDFQNQSWFCVVSLEAPHPPYDAPVPPGGSEWKPQSVVLPPNVPRGGGVEAATRCELSGYYAHVEATDRAIGRLIAAAPLENTVVVFLSVHGDMHGAHGLFRKGWPHEESVRVPLLVRMPGVEMGLRGVRNPALVSLADLCDLTLCWAGGEDSQPGGQFQRISMPCVVRLPHQCDRVWSGVRTRARKLVLGEDGAPWLYFDLERDPGEEVNLWREPARAEEIEALRRCL
jgi:arylsulfatase A-like enzyme